MSRLSVETAAAALGVWGKDPRCVCGCGRLAFEWHHVLSQQRFPEYADEAANIVPVAPHCHERHTTAFKRLPRAACGTAERLPLTPRMETYLDKTYGPLGGAA